HGHGLNLTVRPLQAEEKRSEGGKDHGPKGEQAREFAWCDEMHAREDNRITLRMCFKLELIPHYAVADAAAEFSQASPFKCSLFVPYAGALTLPSGDA